MEMDLSKLIFLLLCGVQTTLCVDWTVTIQYGELHGYPSIRIILHIDGAHTSAYITSDSVVQNKERTLSFSLNLGKINYVVVSMVCHFISNCSVIPDSRINIRKIVLSDGNQTYHFLRDCELNTDARSKLFTPQDIPANSTDPAPCYRPTSVKVKFDLQWNNSLMPHNENGFKVKHFLRFICDFKRYENNAYFYVIYFYVDGSYVNFGTELMVYDTAEASVTEDTLMLKFGYKAGVTISCSVGARVSSNGQTGSIGTSEGFYAGIKLLNPSISIERGQSSTVYLEQTVPFGCTLSSPLAVSTGDCKLKLYIIKTSTEDVCHSNTIQHRGVDAIEIQGLTTSTDSDIWTPQNYSFELVSVESMKGIYGLTTLQFVFHIEASSSHHQFWEDVTSDSVQVNVNGGTDDHIWQGKYCYVVCDPHMRSFDGMHYELQYSGSFLLFKHENIPIRVQAEITSCNGNRRTPYCACGVVVAAGRDVFQIYLCNGHRDIRYICRLVQSSASGCECVIAS
ncbi:von Willebrand factor D and EGF domain-containing protein-like [Argopecten irradians]|uniref:von Willebrand factor D and EGF domain-containing protein-like n=1 Tax=Argopecten irradians TaxID=31199 RepID=UPI00371D3C92